MKLIPVKRERTNVTYRWYHGKVAMAVATFHEFDWTADAPQQAKRPTG
jgi:hypothetical protein